MGTHAFATSSASLSASRSRHVYHEEGIEKTSTGRQLFVCFFSLTRESKTDATLAMPQFLFCFCEATLELHGLWKLLAGLLTCSVRWLVACVRFALYSVVLCLHALAISSCGGSALLDLAQFLSINFRLSFGSTVLSLTSCLKIGLFFNSSGSAKTVTRQNKLQVKFLQCQIS